MKEAKALKVINVRVRTSRLASSLDKQRADY